MKRQHLLTIFVMLWLGCAMAANDPPPMKTIASLELPRYLGKWYEIAKYPNRFQKQCVSHTVAEYSVKAEGQLQVLNRCRRADGQEDMAVGAAKQIGDTTSPKLQVRFAPAWLSFIPLVWGDYWVIDLDADYQLAAVSEPKREYLWVLSRTPQVDPKAYEALMVRLKAQGLDPSKLEMTNQ